MENFLVETELVDFSNPLIQEKAKQLAKNKNTAIEIAKACFEFVRDEINHSGDVVEGKKTTYKASDVLEQKTGWC